MKTVRIIVTGLGNVGKAFIELLAERADSIEAKYGLELVLSSAVDIGGAAVADDSGLPAADLLSHLREDLQLQTLFSKLELIRSEKKKIRKFEITNFSLTF